MGADHPKEVPANDGAGLGEGDQGRIVDEAEVRGEFSGAEQVPAECERVADQDCGALALDEEQG